jgi:hypothetical protein
MGKLTALFLFLSSLASFAAEADLGRPSKSLPYDRYMGSVRSVLGALDNRKAEMDVAKQLMKQGRSFRYHLDDPYVPAMPSVTAREREGDCKDKALWLCDQLNDSSVRFVIGKTSPRARMSHAWVMWQHDGRWWVLDCTLKSVPIAVDTLPADRYIPLYSYAKNRSFSHASTPMHMAAVATRKNATVALKTRR